jgi:ABC-type sugar transport system permease subunit
VAGTTSIAVPARRTITRRRRLAGLLDNERTLGYLLVAPVVLLLAGLVAYPLAVAIGYALSDRTIADPGEFTGLDNFFNLFQDQIYRLHRRIGGAALGLRRRPGVAAE